MDTVEFKDKGFESEVKRVLSISTEQVTLQDLSAIKGVLITSGPIGGISIPWTGDSDAYGMVFPNLLFNIDESQNGEWIKDLRYFTHIKSLHMYMPTQDLGFMRDFKKLKELYVTDSVEEDWTFLANLTDLRYLYVKNCSFQDLTPLHELHKKQEELYLDWKKVNKENSFYFARLQNVLLNYCGITDISPLATCKYISELNLSHNEICDLSPLKYISNLYYLTLRHNNIMDITPLSNIKRVYMMNLRHNCISDITVLENYNNSNLSRLFLGHNPITDFSPIRHLQLIQHDIDQWG